MESALLAARFPDYAVTAVLIALVPLAALAIAAGSGRAEAGVREL